MNIHIHIIIFICVATPTTSLMTDCSAPRNDFNTFLFPQVIAQLLISLIVAVLEVGHFGLRQLNH